MGPFDSHCPFVVPDLYLISDEPEPMSLQINSAHSLAEGRLFAGERVDRGQKGGKLSVAGERVTGFTMLMDEVNGHLVAKTFLTLCNGIRISPGRPRGERNASEDAKRRAHEPAVCWTEVAATSSSRKWKSRVRPPSERCSRASACDMMVLPS
jgi:hypothetical protein